MTRWKRARRWLWTAPATILVAGFAWAFALAGMARLPPADFRFNNNSEVSTLDPAAVSSVPEGRILRALGEGLVIRDPRDLKILPGAAEAWERSPDGLTWTFHLREGLEWSNGEPLTASDFAFSFQRLLLPSTASPFAQFLFAVAGAEDFHRGRGPSGRSDWTTVGVRVRDPRTLVLELASPRSYLLDLLATTPLIPVHEKSLRAMQRLHPERWMSQWLRPENLVTNGPYVMASRRINDRIRLVKNPRYWDRDQVAFGSIDALAVEHWGTALNMYLTGGCDWLDGSVPPLFVQEMLGREDFRPESSPYLGLYFYRLNCTKPPLDDKRVRRALYLAVNRDAVCTGLLGAGQAPCFTFVPWGKVASYQSPLLPSEPPAMAARLLRDAGYGPQRPLPALRIHYNTAESHRDVAEVIADGWKRALALDVGFANQEWKVWLDSQNRLDYQISRSSWIADFPDAISFLGLFTSDNPNNRTGWKNAQFDRLIARSEIEAKPAVRNQLLAQAERILLDEVPAIPIYSYVAQNVVHPRLGGFGNNPLNEQNPKFWHWRSDQELQAARRELPPSIRRVHADGPAEGLHSPAAMAAKGD